MPPPEDRCHRTANTSVQTLIAVVVTVAGCRAGSSLKGIKSASPVSWGSSTYTEHDFYMTSYYSDFQQSPLPRIPTVPSVPQGGGTPSKPEGEKLKVVEVVVRPSDSVYVVH